MSFELFIPNDECTNCRDKLHPRLWQSGIRVCERCQKVQEEKAKEEARSNALGRANGRIRG